MCRRCQGSKTVVSPDHENWVKSKPFRSTLQTGRSIPGGSLCRLYPPLPLQRSLTLRIFCPYDSFVGKIKVGTLKKLTQSKNLYHDGSTYVNQDYNSYLSPFIQKDFLLNSVPILRTWAPPSMPFLLYCHRRILTVSH